MESGTESDIVVLFSYCPLLVGDPGAVAREKEEQMEAIKKFTNRGGIGQAMACIWMKKDEAIVPVFIYKNAKAIADHITAWAEGDLSSMFTLTIKVDFERRVYAIAVFPRITKSIERWKIAYQLRVGFPPAEASNYRVLFQPLNFMSKPGSKFVENVASIGARLPVYLLDERFVDKNDFSKSRLEKAIKIGELDRSEEGDPYLESLIKEESEEPV